MDDFSFIGPFNKDDDGFELALWGRFYATPDLALTLRGDAMFSNLDFDFALGPGPTLGTIIDGYAITGDAEYLVWDQGLSLFAGARYANRNFGVTDEEFDLNDFQVFAGVKSVGEGRSQLSLGRGFQLRLRRYRKLNFWLLCDFRATVSEIPRGKVRPELKGASVCGYI